MTFEYEMASVLNSSQHPGSYPATRNSKMDHREDDGSNRKYSCPEVRNQNGNDDPDQRNYIHEFFHKEPCIYSHHVYKMAAKLLDSSKKETSGEVHERGYSNHHCSKISESLEFENEAEKRQTYTLAFQTLKYKKFLEDILEEGVFFSHFPEFKEDISLVLVMLSDFRERKFQRRTPILGEQLDPNLLEIENALSVAKTKLNAALARSRINAQVQSIDNLLPESVRKNESIADHMYICCWVNQFKTDMNTVLANLYDEGFTEVTSLEEEMSGKLCIRDHQCSDVILFPSDQWEYLESHALVEDKHLVVQDRSSCIGPHSIRSLVNDAEDILHINIGSGITTAHIASLCHSVNSSIYAVGITDHEHHLELQQTLATFGAKSKVKLLHENWLDLDPSDERLKQVRVILLTAKCTRSGVVNPVNFLIAEQEDISLLKTLSGENIDTHRVGDYVIKHSTALKHALKFAKVHSVVYSTCSVMEAENEHVVTGAIEFANMRQQKKVPFQVCSPVLPRTESQSSNCGKYLKYSPSSSTSGCFVAVIAREVDDVKESAKQVLARAAAHGLLSREASATDTSKKIKSKSTHTPRKEKSKLFRKPQPRSIRRTKSVPYNDKQVSSVSTAQVVNVNFQSSSVLTVSPNLPIKRTQPSRSQPTRTKSIRQANRTRLYASPSEKDTAHPPKPVYQAPYVKVVKHPSPFR